MKCDLLIQNGHVVDPIRKCSVIENVYVRSGKIIDGKDVTDATITYDATGKYVFPGLIDYHAHVFSHTSEWGIETDMNFLPQGVTTVVDPGSAGVAAAGSFMENIVQRSEINVLGFLNVCTAGLGTMKIHENVNPEYWDAEKLKYYFTEFPNIFKGLKLRISKDVVCELGLKPLYKAIDLGEKLGVPLAVHTTDAPETQDKVAEALRAGDIFVHCFQGTGNTILGEDGKLLPAIKKAQQRGVLMDAANGRGHFYFTVAEAALAEGFVPDIISTDLTIGTLYMDPVFSLPYIMSKYLFLGLSLEKVVECCTSNPAKALGLEKKIGSLMLGSNADISVMSLIEKKIEFTDTQKQTRQGNIALVPEITVCNGRTVYRNIQSL